MTYPISSLPAGTAFSRFAMALGHAKGAPHAARQFAERWRDAPQVREAFELQGKAAVPAATPLDSDWAAPLAVTGIGAEALAWLRGVSIVGALEGKMRRVPFLSPVPRQLAGGTGGARVAEGQAVALVSYSYDTVRLDVAKIQTLVVVVNELLRPEYPNAERTLRESLLANLAATIDRLFLDPAAAGSITNGITPVTSSGTTLVQMTTDFAALLAGITTAGTALTWIMRPATAARVGLSFGSAADVPRTLFGLPVILSANSPQQVTLVDAAEILYADDGGFVLTLSQSGTIQMDSAPTNNSATPTATQVVSLFQTDSTAFLASRWINWERLQDGAVSFMVTSY